MSSETPALKIDNVGKAYRVFGRPSHRLWQALSLGRRTYFREHWALRNVSFEIAQGEAVGILGRNGSGKSTLMQIMAGTLSPTEGQLTVQGRLAPLLELGSGFNMEFSGRENVFLNAAILGLSAEETKERFGWIEAFADIGQYIDEPVKTYSSGMFARLAFAVAAAVSPDVLLVDEILAVGDIGFQQKCISWMREQRERGMTLVFVTHSPDAIRSLCNKALFLINGRVDYWGPAEPGVDRYLEYIRTEANREALSSESANPASWQRERSMQGTGRYGTGDVQFVDADLLDGQGRSCRAFNFGAPVTLRLTVKAMKAMEHPSLSFLVRDATGVDLFGTTTFDEGLRLRPISEGEVATVDFAFSAAIRGGNYGISFAVTRVSARDYSDVILLDQIDAGLAFTVLGNPDRPVHYKFHNAVTIESALMKA